LIRDEQCLVLEIEGWKADFGEDGGKELYTSKDMRALLDDIIECIKDSAAKVAQRCPVCDCKTKMDINVDNNYYVYCCNTDCGMSGPNAETEEEAIVKWNRLTVIEDLNVGEKG
jgi:hypothetical protein